MTEKKSNEPELIEDKDLDDASGGLLPAVRPTDLKIQKVAPTTTITPESYKIDVGTTLADGSV